ncbi:hypothetical protein [Aliikangiella coralliicola]|uniref:DUF4345 domain-containing protein n=1 Tax=Aliikangiella coralliicola TaxID=2592383 RepID=A0A545UIW2_9GAMM|nr:hypothetical protein [Aliikangiella coralliicola]TQV89414.1 hypothetical protein FLL46_00595 [Aliikangiella coralliicola]
MMKIDNLGKVYTAIMAIYFVVSGFNALMDIDSKLARIGLSAVDLDGKVAFILIYCSLMVGIGIALALIFYFSKTWIYSAILAVTIVSSFIAFRLLGSIMLGAMSSTQISFILVELIEVAVGLLLIIKSRQVPRVYAG